MTTQSACLLAVLAAGHIVNATAAEAPYSPSPVIADLVIDWSTHQRHAQGSDNFQLTWADDDHQYGAWGDGGGFGGSNSDGRVGLGFARIEGGWDSYKGFNVWGGKDPENPAQFTGKSWGTICVDGVLYSWVTPDQPDTGDQRDHYRYVELARSTDHGAHWTKAEWRWWRDDNLIVPTFLAYGKNNAGARDDYVYAYFIRPQDVKGTQSTFGLNVHKPGALFLSRVPRDRVFAGREAYEWFTGVSGGRPTWGPLADKRPVFENPDGTGWCVSASYNPGLGRYLLATEHSVSHSSVMSLFDAPQRWGPWTTVKYWTPNKKFGDVRPGSTLDWADNVFFFSFAPKWLSDDGRSFTLVFTGGGNGKNNDSLNTVRGTFQLRNPASATMDAKAGRAKGPLRVHPENPRYFTDGSGKAIYLAGSQAGGWDVQDDAWGGYAAPGTRVSLDFAKYLDHLTAHGHNLIRLWIVETTRWDVGPPAMVAAPMPFARTGPGNALDGRPKFDLTRFDQVYFDRLRSRVIAAGDRGIYVMVMLFEGFSCVHEVGRDYVNPKANPWFGHPFNAQNNINGIDGDLDGDGWGREFHSLGSAAVVALQKAYVRKVLDTVNDLDNVLYEIANESIPPSKEWQYDLIKTIQEYEAGKPKQHPVVMSAYWPGKNNPALFAGPADAVAPQGYDEGGVNYRDNPPPATGAKVVLADADHIDWRTEDPRYVWRNFLRGNHVIIFDPAVVPFDFIRGMVVPDDKSSEPIRWAVGHVRAYADRINLAEMTPQGGLCSTGYCLARTGSEYVVYQPKSGPFSVALRAGEYAYEWFNPATGTVAASGSLTTRGARQSFTPPFADHAVLYLKRR